jgi:hypothetical protein
MLSKFDCKLVDPKLNPVPKTNGIVYQAPTFDIEFIIKKK